MIMSKTVIGLAALFAVALLGCTNRSTEMAAVIDTLSIEDDVCVTDNYNEYTNIDEASDSQSVYNHSKFSFRYPSVWSIVQENNRTTAHTTIAVQIMDKTVGPNDFAPNINVIVSNDKHKESTNQLARISFRQIKDAGLSCKLNKISEEIVGGHNGSLVDYSVNLQGYNLRVLQYIVKKADNTTFTITITLDGNKYSSQKDVADQMINSFKIK